MALTFVTGKGGVGKTRLSLLLAQKNKAALSELASNLHLEAKSLGLSLEEILTPSRPELYKTFIKESVPFSLLGSLLTKTDLFQNLLQLAPNLFEILLEYWIKNSDVKDLVVDAPSTGHFLAILSALSTGRRLFEGGFLRQKIEFIDKCFSEQNRVSVAIVTLPEQSALSEMKQIESDVSKDFPHWKILRILNRKHSGCEIVDDLPENLRRIAKELPLLESQRLGSISFALTLSEGQQSL